MAKRPRLTVEDVLQQCDDGSHFSDDDDNWDDPHQRVMEGSDDEFSDLEIDGSNDNTDSHTAPSYLASPPASPSAPSSSDTVGMSATTSASSHSTTWSERVNHLNLQDFSSPAGPTVDLSSSPLHVFGLFFTQDLLEEIATQTNSYSRTVMGAEKYDKWTKVSVVELKAFLGFSVLMGINHLPSRNDYWSRDPRLHYAPVADRISRDRFRELSRFLHFVDNDTLVPRGSDGHDRLGK